MVARLAVLAAVLLSASCTSIFDSYFPDSVEYLEAQADLTQVVGTKGIVGVHMDLMQATAAHAQDILTVIVDTGDGGQTVILYSAGLKKIKSYSPSALTAANLGQAPNLYPILQDARGLATGQVVYPFVSGNLQPIGQTGAAGILAPTSAATQSRLRSAFYDDGSDYFTVIYSPGNPTIGASRSGPQDDVSTLSDPPADVLFPPITPSPGLPTLMAATSWAGTFYMMFSSNGLAYLAKSTTITPEDLSGGSIKIARPQNGDSELSQGWASASAAILKAHADGGTLLNAFSWDGKDLGSTRITSDNQEIALAFHPSGKSWYSFDPATSKISEYRPWW